MPNYSPRSGVGVGSLKGCASQGKALSAMEVSALTGLCSDLAVAMLDGHGAPAADLNGVAHAVPEWARAGVPLDAIHHAIHDGFRRGIQQFSANACRSVAPDVAAGAERAISLLNAIISTVSLIYIDELKSVLCERHRAANTLTTALLGGRSTSTMARECGVTVAESYTVLALSISVDRDDPACISDGWEAAQCLDRMRDELDAHRVPGVLSLLGAGGGTVLVPWSGVAADDLDDLVERLSGAGQVAVTATSVHSARPEIPAAAEQAHELLNLVRQVRSAPGLYRFDDFALEYQLTRPGPGRRFLAALLDPLDTHPDLIDTLRVHLANELNRRRTARQLHVHANTIDYRLQRIKQLTGLDPYLPSGLWYLRSALIVRSHEKPRT